jgi:hypothetical protein
MNHKKQTQEKTKKKKKKCVVSFFFFFFSCFSRLSRGVPKRKTAKNNRIIHHLHHAPQLYLTATADAANESMMTKDIVENFFFTLKKKKNPIDHKELLWCF